MTCTEPGCTNVRRRTLPGAQLFTCPDHAPTA